MIFLNIFRGEGTLNALTSIIPDANEKYSVRIIDTLWNLGL